MTTDGKKDKNKPKTESGTPAGTGGKKTGVDLNELMKAYASAGGNVSQGPKFTSQDATYYVEGIYNQLLGRNASGAERTKGVSIFLNQAAETDLAGRQAAVVSAVQESPEFKARQENRYLDAIYNAVAEEVRRAQA